jgi:hypothetical protein
VQAERQQQKGLTLYFRVSPQQAAVVEAQETRLTMLVEQAVLVVEQATHLAAF